MGKVSCDWIASRIGDPPVTVKVSCERIDYYLEDFLEMGKASCDCIVSRLRKLAAWVQMARSLDPKPIGSWVLWPNDLFDIGSKVQGVGRLNKNIFDRISTGRCSLR